MSNMPKEPFKFDARAYFDSAAGNAMRSAPPGLPNPNEYAIAQALTGILGLLIEIHEDTLKENSSEWRTQWFLQAKGMHPVEFEDFDKAVEGARLAVEVNGIDLADLRIFYREIREGKETVLEPDEWKHDIGTPF